MLREQEAAELSAALGAPGRPTVLVAGEAGVGKSRLTEHVLDRYLAAGGRGRRCVASSALQEVPFGALVGLIPAHHMAAVAAGTQQLSVFAMVVEDVLAGGATDDRPFVVLIDDLHHLDDPSCGLLVQLTANAPVQLVATYRTGEPLPDGALPLWTAEGTVRVQLTAFGREDTEEVIRRTMGDATPEVRDALWQHSRGNALYLRELIVGSVAAGRIALHAGTWVLQQPLVGSTHLSEYLLQSVRRLPPVARRLADTLALCQPLPLAMFHGAELGALEALTMAGVAVTTGTPLTPEVRLSHPIYADVIRHQLTQVAQRAILAEVVDRIQPYRTVGDDVRMTVWHLDAGGAPPVDELVKAARAAMAGRDLLLAVRLTRAAQAAVPNHPTASLVLSDALYEMGEFEAAAVEATAALSVATDPDDQGLLVASLYRAYLWGLDDADGAKAVVDFALAVTPPGPAQTQLEVAAANALSFSDRPMEAMERLARLDRSVAETVDGSLFAPVREATLAQLGRTDEAVAVPVPEDAHALHTVVRTYALAEHGQVDDAAEVAQQLRTDVLGLALTLDQMWAALNAGRAHLIAGRPRSALVWAGDALIVAERAGLVAGQALTASVLAAAHAQLGDREGAEAADGIAERLQHVKGFLRAERAVGRAWTAFVRHEESTARALLVEAADGAAAAGQLVSETFLLHEHLRLGGAPHADRLAGLAARSASPLVRARALLAEATEAADSTALAAAGEAFAELGLHLYAAEAFAAAARAGKGRVATGHRTRSEDHRAHCEGAVAPLLEGAPDGPLALLSRREREIAALAVDGLSAREIGEKLFLSVRTVENHLHRVYVKLGTTNRKELARYFAVR